MFRCYTHKYKTINPYEWDKHCYKTKHKLTIWEKGKGEHEIIYPKNYMLKQYDYYGMNHLYMALYMKSKDKKKKKK